MNKRRISIWAGVALALALPLTAGCFGSLQPAKMTYQGIQRPILLGPVDRIGGGERLATTPAGAYEGEATAMFARSESGNTVTETNAVDNLTAAKGAITALERAGGDADIRITKVRTWAKGFISIIKNAVLIEGDVVKVGGAR